MVKVLYTPCRNKNGSGSKITIPAGTILHDGYKLVVTRKGMSLCSGMPGEETREDLPEGSLVYIAKEV